MGSDDIFHKKREKAAKASRRQKAKRQSYDKVLIVCEGKKTESFYFKELIADYEINTANVHVSGDCDSDPMSVVNHGLALYKQEKESPSGVFDKVYFVFDRDTHSNYAKALTTIKKSKPADTFIAITSVPCFEYWLLLHFKYTTSSYAPTGNKSPADQVLSELKNEFPNYAKAEKGVYSSLKYKLDKAKKHAQQSLDESKINGSDNPSTLVHDLVDYLQKIKEEK
jgi:hypothetical protein